MQLLPSPLPWKKSHPSKSWGPIKPPSLKMWLEVQRPTSQQKVGEEGAHYMNILNLNHTYNSDQQHMTMSKWKTEYIICFYLINNIERFLLQVARASYLNQLLLNFFIQKFKLINFPNTHFSILYQYLLHIVQFPFNILFWNYFIFYFLSANLALILLNSFPAFFSFFFFPSLPK